MIIRQDVATRDQVRYIDLLFNDCGFDLLGKKGLLKADYKVQYTDELTKAQASKLIEELKQLKEDKQRK